MIFDLHKKCSMLYEQKTVSELFKFTECLTHELDFATFSITVIVDHSPYLTQFQNITNAPSSYLDHYNDPAECAIDPASQHCKTSSAPIVWNQSTYVEHGVGWLWERQAQFGYESGLQRAIHLPHGRHLMFGVDCDRPLISSPRSAKAIVNDFMVLTPYIQAVAFELSDIGARPDGYSELSGLEIDILRWSMGGHNADWIAKRARLSEQTIHLKISNILKKLDCSTRYEAVVKAIRKGFIVSD
ncbi:MAG TPA: autoinducer binding domain-containing protein [Burkholderiaceae bacterium]